jgi:hypothetical protein
LTDEVRGVKLKVLFECLSAEKQDDRLQAERIFALFGPVAGKSYLSGME